MTSKRNKESRRIKKAYKRYIKKIKEGEKEDISLMKEYIPNEKW